MVIFLDVGCAGRSSPIALAMFSRSQVITCDKIKESRKTRSNTVGILDADCPGSRRQFKTITVPAELQLAFAHTPPA